MATPIHHNSILRKLTLFLVSVICLQCLLFAGFILLGGTVERLEKNAVDILSQRTLNRKNYLENEMVQRWGQLDAAQTAVNQAVEDYLRENGLTYRDLDPDQPHTVPLLAQLSDELITLMRRNAVSGAFLILRGSSGLEPLPGEEEILSGLYLRDLDPRSNPTDNSDLMVERGSSELLRSLKIPMDINWSPTFLMDADDICYYAPIRAVLDYPGTAVSDLGYWSQSYTLHDDQVSIMTYTQPLVTPEGEPYGVLGVELATDYLHNLMPSQELGSDKSGAYLLAVAPNGGDGQAVYHPVATNGAIAKRVFGKDTAVAFLPDEKRPGLYLVDPSRSQLPEAMCGNIQPLNLYNTNTPFVQQQWVLVGLLPENDLFSFSHTVSTTIVSLALISLALGLVLALLAGSVFTKPIRALVGKVRTLDPASPVSLPPVNIKEIDELSAAIESLSRNVADASSRLSKIVAMAGIPLAAFQIDPGAARPYYTRDFFALMGLEEPAGGLTTDDFLALLKSFDSYIDVGSPGDSTVVYHLPASGSGSRWVRLQAVRQGGAILGVLVDVTEEIVERRRIEYERDYDLLTNLLNRRSFRVRLDRLAAQPERLKTAAMLMMDLDNLKYLNDTYGHDCGDEYIRCAADVLRRFAIYGGLASRISGDEFYLFLSGYDDRDSLRSVLDQLQQEMAHAKIQLPNGQIHRLRASVGIAWYPDDSTDLNELLRFSDFAMYEAKNAMKGTVKDFDIRTYQRDSFLLYSQDELNRILDEAAIDYAFQPIVDAHTGALLGYEALMRPRSKALQSPLEFLRLARSQSKLLQVERLTWFKAMEAFVALPERGEDTLLFANSIPSQHLTEQDLAEFDRRFAGDLDRIVIELTEGDELNAEATAIKRDRVSRLHHGIAIDDFGTGYSNDALLLSVNPDYVKVDMTIIRGIENDQTRQALFSNLVTLCHGMGVKVIAEGVETEAELRIVVELGADYIQGYFTGEPALHPAPINPEVLTLIRSLSPAPV